ncbi:uncharacterized protein [Macrobrachium rosenbergii]|uniref:uncharacterized protein n=1 Tax=Macrobrachium rosenbergii TaxID=79674 RepID=UPI0034D5B2CD
MMSPPPVLVSLVTILALVATASGKCEFPAEWVGSWFRSGQGHQEPIVITRTSISDTGDCIEKGVAARYLVYEEKFKCHKCMVINMKHANVIQYKESFCHQEGQDLKTLCLGITGDAMLYSIFRLNAEPITCPFRGTFTFSYSKGYGECAQPLSQVDTCAEETRLRFRHQACADVPGSESYEEELECLGSWKEGSNHYLVGKIGHKHANNDEDRYRCFIYERPHRKEDTHTWNLAQSADATCQGLISALEGSKTMKLSRVTHPRGCKFPSWLTAHQHWHTLDYTQSYYLYHKDTTLRISNGTQAPEDLETRGQTDLRLLCHRDLKHQRSPTEHHETHEHHHNEHHGGNHHGHHRDHREHRNSDHSEEDVVTFVTHVTVGCKTGYQCMRIYRRDEHVVQVQFGILAITADEACDTHFWSAEKANITTLVAAGGPPGPCGPYGRYRVRDPDPTCNGKKSPTFTHVTVGCDSGNTLELSSRCPQESVFSYHCHGQWKSEGVTYVVASPMSRASWAPRRVCFAYSVTAPSPGNPSHTLSLTARHDTCIQRQQDAPIALNATLAEQCMQAAITSSSVGGGAMGIPSIMLLLTSFLVVRLLPPSVHPL